MGSADLARNSLGVLPALRVPVGAARVASEDAGRAARVGDGYGKDGEETSDRPRGATPRILWLRRALPRDMAKNFD